MVNDHGQSGAAWRLFMASLRSVHSRADCLYGCRIGKTYIQNLHAS
jgi:hypothetical protein